MAEAVPLGVVICTLLNHLFDDSHPVNSYVSFHIKIHEDMEYILLGSVLDADPSFLLNLLFFFFSHCPSQQLYRLLHFPLSLPLLPQSPLPAHYHTLVWMCGKKGLGDSSDHWYDASTDTITLSRHTSCCIAWPITYMMAPSIVYGAMVTVVVITTTSAYDPMCGLYPAGMLSGVVGCGALLVCAYLHHLSLLSSCFTVL